MKTILSLLLFSFFVMPQVAEARVKVTDISLSQVKSNGEQDLIIRYEGRGKDTPKMSLKDKVIQVELEDAFVWPKIEKKLGKNSLIAYQFNRDTVRARLVLPHSHNIKPEQLMLETGSGEVRVSFPAIKTSAVKRQVKKTMTSARPAPKKAVSAATKKESVKKYDDSYLDQLLKESEPSKDEPVAKAAPKAEAKDFFKTKTTEDNVEMKQAAPARDQGEISLLGYAGKFAGFLVLVIALFYGLVSLMKKGAFKKGKLGFLNTTKMVEVINTTYLGPKRSLLVVRVNKELFLIGSSEQGLSLISKIDSVSDFMKEGEKRLIGDNFDQNLGTAEGGEKEFKIKENINQSEGQDLMENLLKKAENQEEKVSLSDQIKSKLKEMKPLQ